MASLNMQAVPEVGEVEAEAERRRLLDSLARA